MATCGSSGSTDATSIAGESRQCCAAQLPACEAAVKTFLGRPIGDLALLIHTTTATAMSRFTANTLGPHSYLQAGGVRLLLAEPLWTPVGLTHPVPTQEDPGQAALHLWGEGQGWGRLIACPLPEDRNRARQECPSGQRPSGQDRNTPWK